MMTTDTAGRLIITPDLSSHRADAAEGRVQHGSPSTFAGLIPTAVGDPIVVEEIEPITPSQTEALVREQGGAITHHSAVPRYMSEAAWGRQRVASNGDLFAGRSTRYADLHSFQQAYAASAVLAMDLESALDGVHPLVAQAEREQLAKLTVQQVFPLGFFVETGLDDRAQRHVEPDYVDTVRWLASLFRKRAGRAPEMSMAQAVEFDTSPVDTSPGAPAALGGDAARACRILTARGLPAWQDDAALHLSQLRDLDLSLGLPEYTSVSSLITKRTGPTRKPTNLFEATGDGLVATHRAYGMYCRSRLVYMIPDHINRLLLPTVVGLKIAFKSTLGLYHSPEKEEDQLSVMEANGGRVWEADFSAMDRTFSPEARCAIIDAMIDAGWPEQPLLVLKHLEEVQAVMYPSWLGPNQGLTYLQGPKGLLSGLLVTSAFDTIHNLGCSLTSLGRQYGHDKIRKMFEAGTLGMRVQGDDTSLSLPKSMDASFDPDRYVEDMASCSGFVSMDEGLVFLMKLQPLGPLKGSRPTNLMARVLQNTFFNEHPSAIPEIARVGYAARTEHVTSHPLSSTFFPHFESMVTETLRFAKDGGPSPRPGDETRLAEYAASKEGGAYLASLLDALSYRPTAARELAALAAQGVLPSSADEYMRGASITRSAIVDGLTTPPATEDVVRLSHMVWERSLPEA